MCRSIRWSACIGVAALICAEPVFADEDAPLDRTPQDCISTYRIRDTAVIDGKTIVFYLRGGSTYANILDRECPGLAKEKRFMHETRGTQLCSIDHVTVLEQWGASLQRGFTCQLGQFLPISKEEAAELKSVGAGEVVGHGDVDVKEVELGPDGEIITDEEAAAAEPATDGADPAEPGPAGADAAPAGEP